MSNPRPGIYLRNRKKKHSVAGRVAGVDDDVSVDLISGLPEPILHHILCFLTQREAVRTSVLSKSWRNIGPTRPKFDFCEHQFAGDRRKFISVAESTLHRCLNLKLPFQEFRLEISDRNNLSTSFLRDWIPVVLDNLAIKSFHLSLFCSDVPSYPFRAESLKKLLLKRCNLNLYFVGDVKLKNLKSLVLVEVFIEDKPLEFLLSGCPLAEHLVFLRSHGMKKILLNECSNLKHFRYCNWVLKERVESIEMNIPGIESISIQGCPNWFHHHHSDDGNNVFPLLKSLHLDDVRLTSEFFKCLSTHIPSLETLALITCYCFNGYQLSSQTVKHMMIERMTMFEKTFIGDGDCSFPHLNSLCLVKRQLSSGWFDSLSWLFPSLETLIIENCYGLEEYHISSRTIKCLTIGASARFPAKATIDAPNLVEFEYKGHIPASISFENTSVKWKSILVLKSEVNLEYTASSWWFELYEFLKGFVGSQISLDISIDHVKENRKHLSSLVAAEDTRKPIAVEHMTMRSTGHSSTSLSAFINDMFCIFRPRNMTQFMHRSPRFAKAFEENQLSEYLKKVLLSDRVMRYNYLWKQDLEKASMEIDPSLLTSNMDDVKEQFMFRLKWKEQRERC